MSHFNVMVIGDDLEKQLHPYDENREDIVTDKTDEVREIAEKLHKVKRDAYGKYVFVHGDKAEGKDVEEITLFAYYDNDLDKLAEDWCGYVSNDGRYLSHYNPNSKWDWWCIGGRWRNTLLHFPNPKYPDKIIKGDLSTFEKLDLIHNGQQPEQPNNRCDAAALCDIDWEAMAEADRADAVAWWEHFMEQNPDLEPGMSQEELKAFCDSGGEIKDSMYLWGRETIPSKQEVEDEAYALTTYALVKNGEWFERGEMGWFGISSNEKTCAEWSTIFEQQIEGLPEDTTITIIDCHI